MKLAKQYTPSDYEPTAYAMWETSGAFAPRGEGEPYSIVMPPPNANANLHIGHALDMNLKDIMARYQRMKGRDVAFIPGADHAGFETWVVYERKLQVEGKSRFDFSREQLYSQIWDYVESSRGNMELQLRALGISCNWEDLVFTLDKKVIDTVHDTFKKMWDDGLIYRGERIVNYCTTHQTSFADIEVEHKNEKSKLWDIAYPLLDHIGEIVVATTRPETMLGDTAVAVNPEDERYKHLIGGRVSLPITQREIPIIGDASVDMTFGTGAVKITPAHDPNDYEMAQRHDLPIINIIDTHGNLTNVPAQYEGLSIEAARKKILLSLESEELRRGEADVEHAVGHCYKCGTIIQPLIMSQWFIKMESLASQAIAAIKRNDIAFYPASKAKELINYLSQLRDWNISRQIAWGIPIPAFQSTTDPNDWIFDTRVEEKTIVVNGTTYNREEDTFDTWFSSGQWPYVVTDYLTKGKLSRFFPTDLMETGNDLLRQWVARMIMFSIYRTDTVPFKTVYFHGMVNDEHNQKMSKSKGNVINPMTIVNEYGSDAMRLGIIAGRSPSQNQPFNTGAVVAGRNFCNKLWNIARYVESVTDGQLLAPAPQPQSMADHWIIRQLDAARAEIEMQLADFRFAEAAETVYHVVWDDVADWYLEANKTEQNTAMLAYVLDCCLKVAHPFAPFVTETIWQTLSWHQDTNDMLITAQWPTQASWDDIAAGEFDQLAHLITEIRYVTSELPGTRRYTLFYQDDSLIADNEQLVRQLAKLTEVTHVDQSRGIRLAASGRDAWIDVDTDTLYEHQSNLEKRLAEARSIVQTLEKRLSTESYLAKAPHHLIEESRQQLRQQHELVDRLERELSVLD
jgi:valyl-tRNA synthetase